MKPLKDRLPAFNAAAFEQLSHAQKLEYLTLFLDAVRTEQPQGEPKPAPRQGERRKGATKAG